MCLTLVTSLVGKFKKREGSEVAFRSRFQLVSPSARALRRRFSELILLDCSTKIRGFRVTPDAWEAAGARPPVSLASNSPLLHPLSSPNHPKLSNWNWIPMFFILPAISPLSFNRVIPTTNLDRSFQFQENGLINKDVPSFQTKIFDFIFFQMNILSWPWSTDFDELKLKIWVGLRLKDERLR